jgi:hypothetical protein
MFLCIGYYIFITTWFINMWSTSHLQINLNLVFAIHELCTYCIRLETAVINIMTIERFFCISRNREIT